MSQVDAPEFVAAAAPPRAIRLGEELPIFCEKCGYALHGLPQAVCERCEIRHFHCPECGHHQPINTLRPAFQRVLGRFRAFMVVWVVLLKVVFFGITLVSWTAGGYEGSYRYRSERVQMPAASTSSGRYYSYRSSVVPRVLRREDLIVFGLLALSFGLTSRMLLLRWRRGLLVGLVLAGLVCAAMSIGAVMRQHERHSDFDSETNEVRELPPLPSPFTGAFFEWLGTVALSATVGAAIAWPVWYALVFVLLPRRTGQSLLAWQSAQSDRGVSGLARE